MSSKNYKYLIGAIGLLFIFFGVITYLHPTTYYHAQWKGESPLLWVGFGVFMVSLSVHRFRKNW